MGAWAVRKVLNKQMQFVKLHMSSTVPSTQLAVTQSHRMCSLLEDHIIANFCRLNFVGGNGQGKEDPDPKSATASKEKVSSLVYVQL